MLFKLVSATDRVTGKTRQGYEKRIGRIGEIDTEEVYLCTPLRFTYLYNADGTPYEGAYGMGGYLSTSWIIDHGMSDDAQTLTVTTVHTVLVFERVDPENIGQTISS